MPDSFVLTLKAREDLGEIWSYTAEKWSEAQADRYFEMIIETCRKMSRGMFPVRHYLAVHPEILGAKAGRHVIFFKTLEAGQVQVIRILHESMDLDRHMDS